MMSINLPIRSFDLSPVNGVVWMVFGYAFSKGMDFLLKQGITKIDRKTLWKNYNWSRIFLNLLVFASLACVSNILEKLHLKITDKKLAGFMFKILFNSYLILAKIEPEFAKSLYHLATRYIDQLKVNKITGLDKSPDLSDL